MKEAKLRDFQVYERVLYCLDENGTLWRNEHPPTPDGWVVIPGPTVQQKLRQDAAIESRRERFNIDADKP